MRSSHQQLERNRFSKRVVYDTSRSSLLLFEKLRANEQNTATNHYGDGCEDEQTNDSDIITVRKVGKIVRDD